MLRPIAVFSLAVAGVFVLAGAGWALIAGAILVAVLWRREPDWQRARRRVAIFAASVRQRVTAAPRQSVAGGSMVAGLALAPAGFGLAMGPGVALIAAGVALAALALITGWNH